MKPSDAPTDRASTDQPGSKDSPDAPPLFVDDFASSDRRLFIPSGLLGVGGTCYVYRVHDVTLNRTLALKVLRKEIKLASQIRARFHREAVITARLEHPGIIPVHRVGELADGRPFSLMPMVKGKTFEEMIKDEHAAKEGHALAPRTLRRLVEYVKRAANAIAYAHEMGIVHRDIKPANIMVGSFDNLFVLDWGIAKVLERDPAADDEDGDDDDRVENSWPSAQATRIGRAIGTPAYMPPEQARGDHQSTREAADIYALAGTLYTVITGRQLLQGSVASVLRRLREGQPPKPIAPELCPDDLRAIVEQGLEFDPQDRFRTMLEMIEAIDDWLTGRERAEQAATEATLAGTFVDQFLAAPAPLTCTDVEARDAAAARRTDLLRQARGHTERGLQFDPASPALRDLSRRIGRLQALDEYDRRVPGAARLFDDTEQTRSPDDPGMQLAIATDAQTSWRLFRLARGSAHYRPEDFWFGGSGPDHLTSLPRGSYVLQAVVHGHTCVSPAYLPPRGSSLGGAFHPACRTKPGGQPPDSVTIHLATPDDRSLADLEPTAVAVVPGGPFLTGGDVWARDWRPSRWVEVPSFAIQRRCVDVRAFLRFLRQPEGRDHTQVIDRLSGPRVGSDPIHHVPVDAAMAYAQWLSKETGRTWRLPTVLEWEKAARGVDGRLFPWGDGPGNPNRLVVAATGLAEPVMAVNLLPEATTDHPDRSVYGAEFMAGGVCEYCTDESGGIVACGGSFRRTVEDGRSAMRHRVPLQGDVDIGFRLVTPIEPGDR